MHEKAVLQSYLKPEEEAARMNGENMMLTLDALARRQATENGLQVWKGTHTTRATLAYGTGADYLKSSIFTWAQAVSGGWQFNKFQDGSMLTIVSDEQFADFVTEGSSVLLLSQGYTERGEKLMLNWEQAKYAGIRLVVSPHAKKMPGTGAAPTTGVNTTLSSAASAGATTISVTANTNISAGNWLAVGTAQSTTESDTTYLTEYVYVQSVSGTTITITGSAGLGGLRYAHDSGVAVTNKSEVHMAVFCGPRSLGKVYSKELGEFGEQVGPKVDGLANQFISYAWKWHGGYGTVNAAWLIRAETAIGIR